MSARRYFRKACGATISASVLFVACSGWDPSRPFEREAPEVRESITHLGDAGDAAIAMGILEEYLVTGQCKEGNIGTPSRVRERPNGTFDLGLALFKIGEAFGRRFGEEEVDAGPLDNGPLKTARQEQVECGLRIVRAIATDPSQPVDLRARARFVEGNLLFLDARYEDAVKAYDQSLELIPGMHDSGPISAVDSGRTLAADTLGRDTAWNRAIALRRIEDKKDAGKDGSADAANEGDGGGGDGGDDKNDDGGSKGDGGNDSGAGKPDAGKDSGGDDDSKNQEKPKEPEEKQDAGPPPPSRQNQDERMLDQLENAPTVQQEAARKQAGKRRVRGMSDK